MGKASVGSFLIPSRALMISVFTQCSSWTRENQKQAVAPEWPRRSASIARVAL